MDSDLAKVDCDLRLTREKLETFRQCVAPAVSILVRVFFLSLPLHLLFADGEFSSESSLSTY